MTHQAEFRKALAELTVEDIAQKAKEAGLVAIVSVRLYDNPEYATQTEAFDGRLVHHMNLFALAMETLEGIEAPEPNDPEYPGEELLETFTKLS